VATFSSRNVSAATVPAAPTDIWAVLRDAGELAALTPLVRHIDVDGDIWVWHLRGISALGVSIEPTFTEHMAFDPARSITFEHRPPDGRNERAGAHGRYELHDLGGVRTRLHIDITLCVELPLPRMSRRAVERVMATTMQRTGDRFAVNLYERLGLDPATATAASSAS
jgi:carbon monoxide dehydrogenase subunit G